MNLIAAWLPLLFLPCSLTLAAPPATGNRVPVVFEGGHETEGPDRGRPVFLVAGALGVPPEVFREAFSHVRPAGPGTQPEPEQVRKNKEALTAALRPHGITNDRLDAVSNYYRYQRSRGELWPTKEAEAYAIVEGGKVKSYTVTKGGSGYSSAPKVTVPGIPGATGTAKLGVSKDFEKNGAVTEITVP